MSAEIPPDWFLEPLNALMEAVYEHSNVTPKFTITCSAEFGLRIGLAPGGWGQIMSPCGPITVKSEER